MKSTRLMTVLGALLFPLAVVLAGGCGTNGCGNKDDDELPAPVPTPAPTPVPTPAATLVPVEDAGTDADAAADAEADADAGKKLGGGADPTGVRKCCTALTQNANTAPPEQKGGYLAAAAACNGMINSPQGRQALGGLRSLLLGAQMPAACQ